MTDLVAAARPGSPRPGPRHPGRAAGGARRAPRPQPTSPTASPDGSPFGTAGLRGPLRAGPNGMNLAVVRAAAAGLVAWLAARNATGPLVIGFDARRGSRRFAEETARVATGAGRRGAPAAEPLPTPVLAYLIRVTGACAGVVVTASHNPPQDNGYKVYLADGAQLVPPADAEIEAAIAPGGSTVDGPVGRRPDPDPGRVAVKSYVDGAVRVIDPDGARDLVVAYTPLHGVGRAVFTMAFTEAGFAAPIVVPEQAEPDPAFPTVSFPNPEEPGAMDLVLAVAKAPGRISRSPTTPTPTGAR